MKIDPKGLYTMRTDIISGDKINEFIGVVTESGIKARTEIRFGLPRTDPTAKPQKTLYPTITDVRWVKKELIFGYK